MRCSKPLVFVRVLFDQFLIIAIFAMPSRGEATAAAAPVPKLGAPEVPVSALPDGAQCEYYAGTLANTLSGDNEGEKIYSGSSEVAQFSCVDKIFHQCTGKSANDAVQAKGTGLNRDGGTDDCVLIKFADVASVSTGKSVTWFNTTNKEVDFVMDEDCNGIPGPVVAESFCGSFEVNVISSPISLLWTPGADVKQNVAITRFPLVPNQLPGFYTWKASADTPLVVYDPRHEGVIRGADQLFGNWTFGGKRAVGSDGSESAQPWKDGFEALATLDRNSDGKVSGPELSSIGLWFDRNQDGVSQEGEVMSAESAGLNVLYYNPDYTDPGTSDIYARRGFERRVFGDTRTGASVDWYAQYGSTANDLVMRERSRLLPTTVGVQTIAEADRSAAEFQPFFGVWAWRVGTGSSDRANGPISGLLKIGNHQGKLQLSTIVETPIVDRKGRKRTLVSFLPAKIVSAEGPTIRFQFNPQRGTATDSFVTISPEGEMRGVSTASARREGGVEKLRYEWTATKLPG